MFIWHFQTEILGYRNVILKNTIIKYYSNKNLYLNKNDVNVPVPSIIIIECCFV